MHERLSLREQQEKTRGEGGLLLLPFAGTQISEKKKEKRKSHYFTAAFDKHAVFNYATSLSEQQLSHPGGDTREGRRDSSDALSSLMSE